MKNGDVIWLEETHLRILRGGQLFYDNIIQLPPEAAPRCRCGRTDTHVGTERCDPARAKLPFVSVTREMLRSPEYEALLKLCTKPTLTDGQE